MGINIKIHLMERAAYCAKQHNHQLRGVLFDTSSAGGTASARLTRAVTVISDGFGKYDDIQALMKSQAVENNPEKRKEILHKIQQLVHDRYMFLPIHQNGNPCGIGPRVKVHAMNMSAAPCYWPAPYDEMQLY